VQGHPLIATKIYANSVFAHLSLKPTFLSGISRHTIAIFLVAAYALPTGAIATFNEEISGHKASDTLILEIRQSNPHRLQCCQCLNLLP
jgi:hypothetical protein